MTNAIDKKVLIVEDDEDFLFILQKKFTVEGFSVVVAKNGEEGISVAQAEKPDLILSDVLMPKMDGVVMGTTIRKADPHVPIIFLTNIKDVETTNKIQNSKDFDYLIKADTRIDDIVLKVKAKLEIK